ncbi:Tyrosinase-like protein orsC [Penicillium canariense]|uniref:Tyrosinase-like protein orsC n=1 Tax=Penicillium canariense TaxID=189055 RepID=A0A9W9I4A4_9EURO|nr:Tyrosinase-like protein orsC [Penicillium canariense]KAJ5167646.1 Tyrosinase-like protein orsC [Penicillium canariense]
MAILLTSFLLCLMLRVWTMPITAKTNSFSFSEHTAAYQINRLSRFALDSTLDAIGNRSLGHDQGGCTLENVRVRRDWRTFPRKEKRAYINAVLCLQWLPAQTPSALAAGAKSRYDDFVATHINQTWHIHRTGTFLAWHRYFIYVFEETLRDECGYTGDLPYWNWGADVQSMEESPLFDGSDTSLSGNGAYIPNQPNLRIPLGNTDLPPLILPAGTGGGCLTSGPFMNSTINMGPSFLYVPGGNVSRMSNPLDYNPRCLKRDLTTSILRDNNNYTTILQLILNNHDVWDFETNAQGAPGSGLLGVHGGGHLAMGGDPGRDADANPGDPGFWNHHAMIDRLWWIWQNLDLTKRQYAISGTGTFLNDPASPNTTLDTHVNVGYVKPGSIAVRDIMSTTAGPFCYVYL